MTRLVTCLTWAMTWLDLTCLVLTTVTLYLLETWGFWLDLHDLLLPPMGIQLNVSLDTIYIISLHTKLCQCFFLQQFVYITIRVRVNLKYDNELAKRGTCGLKCMRKGRLTGNNQLETQHHDSFIINQRQTEMSTLSGLVENQNIGLGQRDKRLTTTAKNHVKSLKSLAVVWFWCKKTKKKTSSSWGCDGRGSFPRSWQVKRSRQHCCCVPKSTLHTHSKSVCVWSALTILKTGSMYTKYGWF